MILLKKILANPNVCSKEWIWQQYDHTVMGDTIQKPGGDAGVVRVHGTDKAVAAICRLFCSLLLGPPFNWWKASSM